MAVFGPIDVAARQTSGSLVPASAWVYAREALREGSEIRLRILALQPGLENRVEIGGGIFALEQTYVGKSLEQARFESHRRHLDVQVIVSGRELMEVVSVAGLKVTEDFLAERDVRFHATPDFSTVLRVRQGEAAIFLPEDAHRPSVAWDAGARIWKTVIKVPVSAS